ncbi:hypothetical protein CR513_26699, partial [Mucuna pruriens]
DSPPLSRLSALNRDQAESSLLRSTQPLDEPPQPTDTSFIVDRSRYDKWTHFNKVCLMTMKYTMEKTIKDNICDIENAREFLNVVERFDKAEKVHHLSLLRKTTYDRVRGICEHVMKMMRRNLISIFVLENYGYFFHFNNKRVTLSYDSVDVGFGVLHDDLYMLDVFSISNAEENLIVNSIVGYKRGGLLKALTCYSISI